MTFHLTTPDEARVIAKAVRRTKKPAPEAPVYPAATESVTVRLGFPPLVNHYWRSALIGGHVSVYLSGEAVAYREVVAIEWAKVGVRFDGPLAMRVGIVWPNRRRRDVDGVAKGLLDAMEHAGAYADDTLIRLLILESVGTEKPGWVDVTIGQKPQADIQGQSIRGHMVAAPAAGGNDDPN